MVNTTKIEYEEQNLPRKSRRDCQEIKELRRICWRRDSDHRELTNFLCKKTEIPSTVNQLLSQIQELQGKVNSSNEEKEFYDPETDVCEFSVPSTHNVVDQ